MQNHPLSLRPLSVLALFFVLPILWGQAQPISIKSTDPDLTSRAVSQSQLIFCNYDKVFTIRPDGSGRRTLVTRQFVASPSLSFDGKRYAYDFYRDDLGVAETVIANTYNARPPVVVGKRTKNVKHLFPILSPDGQSVVTLRKRLNSKGNTTFTERLMLFDVDGGRRDLGPDTLFSHVARFDPGGHSILFAKSGAKGIFRISVLGGSQGAAQHLSIAREVWEFDIAPDGRHIVFTSPEKGEMKGMYVCTSEGTGLRRLPLSMAQYRSPSWSPDGQHIAFTYDLGAKSPGLRVIDADGKNLRVLTRDEAVAGPIWR